jgi:hypothetical protein
MAKGITTFKGGESTQRYLLSVAKRLSTANVVRVGFLEGATYPARARDASRLLKGLDALNKVGPQLGGKKRPTALAKYRKAKKVKLATMVGPKGLAKILPVATVAFWDNFGTKISKARPFFSDMIAEQSPYWGPHLAIAMRTSRYNTRVALTIMGEKINDALVKKIVDWPQDNAPLTVAIKGFNKGLIDRGIMQRSTGYDVK